MIKAQINNICALYYNLLTFTRGGTKIGKS